MVDEVCKLCLVGMVWWVIDFDWIVDVIGCIVGWIFVWVESDCEDDSVSCYDDFVCGVDGGGII